MQTAVMVGCGAMSEGWLRALQDINSSGKRVEIVGFVDLDTDLAQNVLRLPASAMQRPETI